MSSRSRGDISTRKQVKLPAGRHDPIIIPPPEVSLSLDAFGLLNAACRKVAAAQQTGHFELIGGRCIHVNSTSRRGAPLCVRRVVVGDSEVADGDADHYDITRHPSEEAGNFERHHRESACRGLSVARGHKQPSCRRVSVLWTHE